ncbi:MAG: nitroreductase family protein [Deltaproteobacteria bacterium]|nr:nitroreductase family protein [Deltaproteobacteria bacterium]
MGELTTAIKNRRSIRTYLEKDVPPDLVEQVLDAVKWSPSWANTQVWEVVVIRDRSIKEKLQQTLAPRNPATKALVDAPVLLAMCGRLKASGYYNQVVTTKFGDWFMFDLGIATQSLCLQAHDLGLGTVVVGLFDHDKAGAVLNVPEGYEIACLIPLGFPAKEPLVPKRREIKEFIHFETF